LGAVHDGIAPLTFAAVSFVGKAAVDRQVQRNGLPYNPRGYEPEKRRIMADEKPPLTKIKVSQKETYQMNQRRSRILLLVVAILLLTIVFPAAAQEIPPAVEGGWSTGTPMPTRRSEIASAVQDGMIYVAGGIGEAWTVRSEVERYDIAGDTWETVAPLPVGLHHLGMAALDGRIYVTGGYADMDFTVNQDATYVYDPNTNTWATVAPLPAPRAAHGTAAVMGKLYVVGGVGPRAEEMWAYDLATDTWDTALPPLPQPREHLAVVGAENQLYVIGGRVDGNNLGTSDQFSPEMNQWNPLFDLPTPRGGLTAGVIDGVVYATGGELFEPAQTYNQHEVFRFAEWAAAEPMPTARHGLTSVTHEGRWYVIGGATEATGRTAETATNLVEIYTVRAPYPDDTRTGIPVVDAVIEARLNNDSQALVDLVQFLTLTCIRVPEGIGGPPLCQEDEADGTPVEVFPMAFSEGTHVRRAEIADFFVPGRYTLQAVYRTTDEGFQDESFPSGDYSIIFIDEESSFFNAVNLRVNENGIVRLDYNSWPEMVTGFGIGEFILPPRVPVATPG
jgi:hypothetical protein